MENFEKWLTCTVSSGGGGDFAGGGEGGGLGDIQDNTERSAALKGLTEASGVSLEHSLEANAATPFRLGDGAAVGDEGEAVGHGQDQAGAVHWRCWRVRWGRTLGIIDGPDGQQAKNKRKVGGLCCHFLFFHTEREKERERWQREGLKKRGIVGLWGGWVR